MNNLNTSNLITKKISKTNNENKQQKQNLKKKKKKQKFKNLPFGWNIIYAAWTRQEKLQIQKMYSLYICQF